MSLSLAKKARTSSTPTNSSNNEALDGFEEVRSYLMKCPFAKSDHPAIQAALKGLDQEVRRRERDAKLQNKFMSDAVTVEKSNVPHTRSDASHTRSTSVGYTSAAGATSTGNEDEDDVMTDDWHNVEHHPTVQTTTPDVVAADLSSCSFLGQRLATAAIAAIAEHKVTCRTPLEALVLAFHAALRSPALDFRCTGVPSDKPVSGFAAPIRELSTEQFLPEGWKNQQKGSELALRYRKNGLGAVVLQVRAQPPEEDASTKTDKVKVTLNHTNSSASGEPSGEALVFSISDHINLDSWERSVAANPDVSPALHYKGLATLLTQFSTTFDLGPVAEDNGDREAVLQQEHFPYVDSTVVNLPTRQQQRENPMGAPPIAITQPQPMRPFVHPNDPRDGSTPTTLGEAFPGLAAGQRPGDFAGDLMPGGLVHPGIGGGGIGSGNLMGPNHPAFYGGPPPVPGLGMRPRFDPINGPPGGPTDPNQPPPGPLPKRQLPGEPNPDHLRPPNDLNSSGSNNNMFM